MTGGDRLIVAVHPRSSVGSEIRAFDHALTRFPLDGVHGELACDVSRHRRQRPPLRTAHCASRLMAAPWATYQATRVSCLAA